MKDIGILLLKNKFVRTKMRLKLGTKIDLSERFVRFAGFLDLSDVRFDDFCDLKKTGDGPRTDHGRTDRRTDGRTDPLIEMRRRI